MVTVKSIDRGYIGRDDATKVMTGPSLSDPIGHDVEDFQVTSLESLIRGHKAWL